MVNRRRIPTNATWRALLDEYAKARWCWNEAEDDIERAEADERPDDFADRMAEKWGLDDPCEPWGIFDTPEHRATIQAIRDRITKLRR